MYYQNNKYNKPFTVKKPVRSFRDLDIYQKTLECSVLVVKDLVPELEKNNYSFRENMVNCAMSVPLYIGESHSMRFANFEGGVMLLEKAMAGCNKMIIYLEQMKGVYGSKLDVSLIDDLIGRYADSRTKSFHLERSWKKFKAGELSGEIKPKTGFRY
ncbi:MAG: hypothetical protein WCW04_02945 [Candidatus Paceibacterota bacterium]